MAQSTVALGTAALRAEEFPLTATWTYLNHASVGPFPQRTVRALDEINRAFTTPNVWESRDRVAPQVAIRAAVGRMTGVAPERVAFVASLAHGISICAAGIACAPGDEVIIPHSEYPSLAIPFLAQEPRGLHVRWAPKSSDGRTDLGIIASLVSVRTRAIALSHVEFADGFRNDLAALGALCRERDLLLIVDATQSIGAIPLELESWGVHAAVAHGYKWLHSGFGIGVMALSSAGLERIRPTHAGGHSVCENPYVAEPRLAWHDTAQRFETGDPPHTLIAGMAASITLVEEVGVPNILPHAQRLVDLLVDGARAKGYQISSSLAPQDRSQFVAMTTGHYEADVRAHVALTEAGVATALRPRGLRVAPTFYNDEGDIERLLDALPPR